MTGYISKKMLGAARLPDTPSARKYLERVLDDDDTQTYKKPWVGLTDKDIKTVLSQLYCDLNQMKLAPNDRPQKETVGFLFAKAIEAKLKERT